jgi:hypothetical protein
MNMYTNIVSTDGFGAQYQKIIQTYLYCKIHNLPYVYTPFNKMEHNYTNSSDFIQKKEDIINLYNNIQLASQNTNVCTMDYFKRVRSWYDADKTQNNITIACESEHMGFIKKCFWENKDRDVYKNGKKNIAIHVRRGNSHDLGQAGDRITTPDEYYLSIMEHIRKKYNNDDLQFHIYSQGNDKDFVKYVNEDVVLHIDEDIDISFICMVGADILVTSPSSLSYVAALISDGEIYFKPFWHMPRKNWIICR